jgi:hypothetical protein
MNTYSFSLFAFAALGLPAAWEAKEALILKSSDMEKILQIEETLGYLEGHDYQSFHGVEPVEVNEIKCKKVGVFKIYFDCTFNKDIRIDDMHVKRYRASKKIFRNVLDVWTTDQIVKDCAKVPDAKGGENAPQNNPWPQCNSRPKI